MFSLNKALSFSRIMPISCSWDCFVSLMIASLVSRTISSFIPNAWEPIIVSSSSVTARSFLSIASPLKQKSSSFNTAFSARASSRRVSYRSTSSYAVLTVASTSELEWCRSDWLPLCAWTSSSSSSVALSSLWAISNSSLVTSNSSRRVFSSSSRILFSSLRYSMVSSSLPSTLSRLFWRDLFFISASLSRSSVFHNFCWVAMNCSVTFSSSSKTST